MLLRRASQALAPAATRALSALRPFHLAIPVHSIEAARAFYGGLLGLSEGRSAPSWVDFNLYGHQLVVHHTHDDYRGQSHYNPVDGDDVPVPHFGVVLEIPQFKALAEKLTAAPEVEFVIEPRVRFEGLPGEQWTMFFSDPSGNHLEFKAMATTENLFAKQDA